MKLDVSRDFITTAAGVTAGGAICAYGGWYAAGMTQWVWGETAHPDAMDTLNITVDGVDYVMSEIPAPLIGKIVVFSVFALFAYPVGVYVKEVLAAYLAKRDAQ